MLDRAGIADNDDKVLFGLICEEIRKKENPYIEQGNMVLEVVKWAERNNYAPMRLTQSVKRMLNNFVRVLARLRFCRLKLVDSDVQGFMMVEPEAEQILYVYTRMEKDIERGFPMEKDLPVSLLNDMKMDVVINDFSINTMKEAQSEDLILKIHFPELEKHILISPKLFPQILTICYGRLRAFFKVPGRLRILDDISRSLDIVLPGKDISSDHILEVLDQKAKEEPLYFVHFAESLIRKIGEDRNRMDMVSIYQAAHIVKRLKMEQETTEQSAHQQELQADDIKKMMNIIKGNPKTYTRAEILRFREGEGHNERFAGSYDRNAFLELTDLFLKTYCSSDEDENPDPAPEIIKLEVGERDLYIYREFLIGLLERERGQVKEDTTAHFTKRWSQALLRYQDLPDMKKDKAFNEEIQKYTRAKYELFTHILSKVDMLFGVFMVYVDDKDLYSRYGNYFAKQGKAELKPLNEILDLKRTVLYRDAYAALPFTYRFFLTRLIIYLINLFKKKQAETEEKQAKEGGASDEGEGDNGAPEESGPSPSQLKKDMSTKLRKVIPDLERKYWTGGKVIDILEALHGKWNIKLGEVRTILKDKVDKDIQDKSGAVYGMLLRSPAFSEEFLHQELKNMANNLVLHKYSEVHDKKSLAQYIVIRALWLLKQKAR